QLERPLRVLRGGMPHDLGNGIGDLLDLLTPLAGEQAPQVLAHLPEGIAEAGLPELARDVMRPALHLAEGRTDAGLQLPIQRAPQVGEVDAAPLQLLLHTGADEATQGRAD